MNIGEKIKQRRKELRWSQRDLAEKMGYNHSTVTRIETGKIDIPQSRILQFAEVLGVSVAYLMNWSEAIETDPVGSAERFFEMMIDEDLNDFFEDFKKLDAAQKKIVKDLAHNLAEQKKEV